MSNRHLCSLVLLSILLLSVPSRVRSLNANSQQAQNSTMPRLTLNITDRWNAPVAINSVRIGDQEVLPGSSIEATDDWAKNISIEGINKSEKTISYIAYDIDFTIAGESNLYRLRLQDGAFNALPDALTAPGGLRVLKGQKHNIRFTDGAWGCQTTVMGKINERKAKVVNVELFVEMVGFTDNTLWAFGSHLKRNKETAVFENVENGGLAKGNNQLSANLARGFVAKGPSATPDGGCCATTMNYSTGYANAVTVSAACSSCPPSAGGGNCSPPYPMKNVNSLSGSGNSGVNQIAFVNCSSQ